MLQTFLDQEWQQPFSSTMQNQATQALESGQVIYFPQIPFELAQPEQAFLSPDYADPHAKNISYLASQHKLWGVQHLTDKQHIEMKNMMDRFAHFALKLVQNLLPTYAHALTMARTSFRPMQISNRKTSYRKDDKRLHVDAFPSAPNQGKRILRVFSNVNPNQEDRVWRVGEPFEKVAQKFLPKITKPFPGAAAALRFLKITKSYRTLYDHYMLHIHDLMKADNAYQIEAPQQELRFETGSTWVVQTDDVSHAAMQGQYAFEQTFYLPINAMQDETRSPLRILERLTQEKLV